MIPPDVGKRPLLSCGPSQDGRTLLRSADLVAAVGWALRGWQSEEEHVVLAATEFQLEGIQLQRPFGERLRPIEVGLQPHQGPQPLVGMSGGGGLARGEQLCRGGR